eukprot:1195187-Prorocentrum_minimum.AAC.3
MVKPGGTASPSFAIWARLAPLPPSSCFIVESPAVPSAPPMNGYTSIGSSTFFDTYSCSSTAS